MTRWLKLRAISSSKEALFDGYIQKDDEGPVSESSEGQSLSFVAIIVPLVAAAASVFAMLCLLSIWRRYGSAWRRGRPFVTGKLGGINLSVRKLHKLQAEETNSGVLPTEMLPNNLETITVRLDPIGAESGAESSRAISDEIVAGGAALSAERERWEAYTQLRVLGRGAHGCAVLLRSPCGKRLVAAKQLHVGELGSAGRAELQREVRILGSLSHPSIIHYLGSFVSTGGDLLSLVMEFADAGTMAGAVAAQQERARGFSTPLVRRWTTQLAQALVHLHSHRVLHRDLKAANVLLATGAAVSGGAADAASGGGASDAAAAGTREAEASLGWESCHVKLGDFGISRTLSTKTQLVDTVVGTPYYMSPEMVMGNQYAEPSDVWALGVILFELLALRRPFEAGNLGQLVLKISRCEIDAAALDATLHPVELTRLVNAAALLHPEPSERMTLQALLRSLRAPGDEAPLGSADEITRV